MRLSVLPLGTQQASETITLLLRATTWENLVEIAVIASFSPPHLTEVSDHVAHRRLCPVPGKTGPQIANDLPVFGGQHQPLQCGQGTGEALGPIRGVDQITLAVGEDLLITYLYQRVVMPG